MGAPFREGGPEQTHEQVEYNARPQTRRPTLFALAWFLLFLPNLGCMSGNNCPALRRLPPDGQTVVLGDSILRFNEWSCSNVAGWLSIMTGRNVTDLSVTGSLMTCPFPHCEDITASYEEARELPPGLRFVILNGGANDMAFERQGTTSIEKDIEALLEAMLGDGVEKILYVGYYPFLGPAGLINTNLARLMAQVRGYCEAHGILFLDLAAVFHHHPEFLFDGIHPNSLGSARIATEILSILPLDEG